MERQLDEELDLVTSFRERIARFDRQDHAPERRDHFDVVEGRPADRNTRLPVKTRAPRVDAGLTHRDRLGDGVFVEEEVVACAAGRGERQRDENAAGRARQNQHRTAHRLQAAVAWRSSAACGVPENGVLPGGSEALAG